MRKKIYAGLIAGLLLAGCAQSPEEPSGRDPAGAPGDGAAEEHGPVKVVTTFSLLGDLASQVGGELVTVHSMVPLGTDPHEYQPLPADVEAATDADVLVWNGLDMETGDGWFENLVEVAGKDFAANEVIEAAAGVEPMWLTEGETSEVNPHAFLSPRAGLIYLENIVQGFSLLDPQNAPTYEANASELKAKIEELDERYTAELGSVATPVLVTSERAFQYLANDYGLSEGYLWQIDTDEQGTPAQITGLISFIEENEVSGLLVETNVDPRPMETVSQETGVPVVGEVYSDELGPAGSPGETYLGYLEANLASYLAAMN